MKLKEILEKVYAGDSARCIDKAISQIRKELEKEIGKIEERFPLSMRGDYDLGAQAVTAWIKRIIKSFCEEE